MNYFQYVLLGISFLSIYSAVFYTFLYFLKKEEETKTDWKPTVSIVSSAYNEENNIERWIKSLLKQTYPVEIYLVDDNSTDKTKSICQKYVKEGKIKYFRNEKNKGKVPNINYLLKNHIKTDLFCVLDADCFYEKDAVEKMVKHFKDKKVGAVIPTTKIHGAKNLLERVQMVEYYLSSFIRPIMGDFSGIYTTNGLTMFSTKAVKRVGHFDEKNLTEDMDMCMRLYSRKYKIVGDPKPHAYTVPEKGINAYLKQRRRWQAGLLDNFVGHLPTIKKHPGMMYVTFPLTFAWIGIITGLFGRLVYNLSNSAIKLHSSLQMINYDWGFYISELFANPVFIRLNIVSITMFTSFLIFAALLTFSITRLETKNKIKTALNTPIYMATYSILLTLTWLWTYAYIIKNKGRRYGWTHAT